MRLSRKVLQRKLRNDKLSESNPAESNPAATDQNSTPAGFEPIISPVAPEKIQAELDALPPENLLTEQGRFQVYHARSEEIPNVLTEIGRLREVTFRAVNEGTGTACDLDKFDDDYIHLFMWDKTDQEIAGSYRIGHLDDILRRGGRKALYTSTLFKFRPGFLEKLGPALELGRSFISAKYQRKPTSLALLWRGIGAYLVKHPQYKLLFGPVSIRRDYEGLSKRMMMKFLGESCTDETLRSLVKPKNPPKGKLRRKDRAALDTLVRDVDDLSALVADIEDDNKGMPVLLRHYLKLNARVLSFNVDPAFGNCIDGLIVVDLRTTEPRLLKRFMGEAGLATFSNSP